MKIYKIKTIHLQLWPLYECQCQQCACKVVYAYDRQQELKIEIIQATSKREPKCYIFITQHGLALYVQLGIEIPRSYIIFSVLMQICNTWFYKQHIPGDV